MFSRAAATTDEDQKDIFAPVADLMVGVVFIFMILILALSLDLSTEKGVPQSTYDLKVEENRVLTQQLADIGALERERSARAMAEKRASVLTADNERLLQFVRFVRDSQSRR